MHKRYIVSSKYFTYVFVLFYLFRIIFAGGDVIEHFKKSHDGPLIQYFKPIITLPNIRTFSDTTCCVVNYDSNVFFLKTFCTSNFLLWVWCMGDERKALEYECVVRVTNDTTNEVLLSVVSSVFSLSTVTLDEIKEKKKGVFLNSPMIKTLSNKSDNEMNICVTISKKD